MRKWRTTKNSNKDNDEEWEPSKDTKKKRVIIKKTKKERKRSCEGRHKEQRH